MERRNAEDSGRPPDPAQVDGGKRHQIESHVERVLDAARGFAQRPDHEAAHEHLATWRVGAVLVATKPHDRDPRSRGFVATPAFLRTWDLDDLPDHAVINLIHYVNAETDRRTATTVEALLSVDEVRLIVDVGRRWGRTAARAVLAEVIPYFIELELGIAASVAADVQRALEAAA
jgi:hypothetical protein